MSTPPSNEHVRAYYDSHAQNEWERLFADNYHQSEYLITIHYLERYLPLVGRVLDAGCGAGRYAIELAQRGFQMTLVDLSEEMLRIARQMIILSGVEKNIAAVFKADICDLSPLSSDYFDSVISLGGPLSHLISTKQQRMAVGELARVTKSGGLVFASVMNRYAELANILKYSPQAIASILKFLSTGNHLYPEDGVFTHTHFYTHPEIKELFETSGLRVLTAASLEMIPPSMKDHINNLSQEQFREWIKVAGVVSCDPELINNSSHFLIVAKKEGKNEEKRDCSR